MPPAVTSREKARDRKARQRERDRERRRIVAMAEAERLEAIAEGLAPAVMRHPVMMGGSAPTLALNDGRAASYVSGSGSNALVFSYTVPAGQKTADLAPAANNAMVLNGATIRDSAGNNAVLSAASGRNPAGALQIDTTAPTITGITTSQGSGALTSGATVSFTVKFSKVVTVAGRMLIGARVQIVAGRPVRAMADPIEDRGPKSLILTEAQRTAARQLQLDWHDVGTGINVAAVDYLRSGGGSGGGMGGHAALLAQCKARARLDGAMAHCGAFAPAVARVVLDCIPVSVWADEAGMTPMDGAAWISAALSRLAQFYAVTRDRKVKVGILAFGPARGSYETTLDAVELS